MKFVYTTICILALVSCQTENTNQTKSNVLPEVSNDSISPKVSITYDVPTSTTWAPDSLTLSALPNGISLAITETNTEIVHRYKTVFPISNRYEKDSISCQMRYFISEDTFCRNYEVVITMEGSGEKQEHYYGFEQNASNDTLFTFDNLIDGRNNIEFTTSISVKPKKQDTPPLPKKNKEQRCQAILQIDSWDFNMH